MVVLLNIVFEPQEIKYELNFERVFVSSSILSHQLKLLNSK